MQRGIKAEVKQFMEYLPVKRYKKGIDWNGYNVYIPKFKGNPKIGLPLVVLVKGNEVRLSSEKECFEYLDYQNSKKKFSIRKNK